MDTKPVFHGSDIEKICSYYNLEKEDIVNSGVNLWGLPVCRQSRRTRGYPFLLPWTERIHIPSGIRFATAIF